MIGRYEDLSEDEKSLAASRARGDYITNCALEWVSRFHSQYPHHLISKLLDGVRLLARAMHGRSIDDIERAINSLLESQTGMLLPNSRPAQTSAQLSQRALPAHETPRAHADWAKPSNDTDTEEPKRAPSKRRGPVFVSYARADSNWLSRLLIHLRPLERSGRIDLWHDGKIAPGKQWRAELDYALTHASSAILVVTANFMASDFISASELPPIAKRARDEGVVVFPVVFGHCLFEEDPYLRDFQLFNDPERPLSRMDSSEADAILVKLAKSINSLTS